MLSWRGGANALSVFKRKKPAESSLVTGLLDNASHEVELSEYGKVPSHGSESPSALLNGESLKVERITDLDLFVVKLYNYHCEKGLLCIIVKWIVEILSLVFIVCFSGFFLLYVDWKGLRNAKCGMDAVESGTKQCDLANEALHKHPLTPFTLYTAVVLGYLSIVNVYLVVSFFKFFTQLKETLRIRHFYYNSLHVTDSEIKTMPWTSVLEKVVRVQSTQQICVVKDLSAHEIIMRLMRKENYVIGMINKGVLAFPIPKWIPGAGPTVNSGSRRTSLRLILTKTLEWTLNWCILDSMFDRNFCVRSEFVSNPNTLKKRLMIVGVVMCLHSPFLVIFMVVYLFLRHAEQFYNHPTTASSRRWSNLSKWMFREYNEVDHLFRHRINSSIVHASDYLKQFPSPILSIVAKFIAFISGGFAAVLIIIAFLDESLLEGHIFGRNLFWYAAVFGTITAISRAAVMDEVLVLDPEGAISSVVQHTHYMPKRWRGNENTETVRKEFETLFQYTAMMWLEELASIFLTPYLLIFVVPKRVEDILQFITEYTVNIEGVGDVCSFSAFDFQRHGNENYGSPHNSLRTQRSSQGKMEKSFLSFQTCYPFWQPNVEGMQFLATLRNFRDQKLRGAVSNYPYSTHAAWQRSQHSRREAPQSSPRPGCHLGSLWFIETDPKAHPYLLDWFYVSRPRQVGDYTLDIPPSLGLEIENEDKDFNGPFFHKRASHLESRSNIFEDRLATHLNASASSPFVHDQSVLRIHESSYTGPSSSKYNWWERGVLGGGDHQQAGTTENSQMWDPTNAPPQASFLDPPEFTNRNLDDYGESQSERSDDVHEQLQLDWRNYHNLSRTTYPEELGGGSGDFKLHFDDIFRPPEEPSSIDHNSTNSAS